MLATSFTPMHSVGTATLQKPWLSTWDADPDNQRIVGTGTLLIERKVIHSCGLVGHIEDVVVHSDYRGLSLGKRCGSTSGWPRLGCIVHLGQRFTALLMLISSAIHWTTFRLVTPNSVYSNTFLKSDCKSEMNFLGNRQLKQVRIFS